LILRYSGSWGRPREIRAGLGKGCVRGFWQVRLAGVVAGGMIPPVLPPAEFSPGAVTGFDRFFPPVTACPIDASLLRDGRFSPPAAPPRCPPPLAPPGRGPRGPPPGSGPLSPRQRRGARGAGRPRNSPAPLVQQDLPKPPVPLHAPRQEERGGRRGRPTVSGFVRFLGRTRADSMT